MSLVEVVFENTDFYDHLINLNKSSTCMLKDLKFGYNSIDEFIMTFVVRLFII